MKQTNDYRQDFFPAIYIQEESDPRPLGEYGRLLLQNLKQEYPDRYWQLSFDGTLMKRVHEREQELNEKKLRLIAKLEKQYPRPHTDSILIVANHMGMLSDQADAVIQQELKQPI